MDLIQRVYRWHHATNAQTDLHGFLGFGTQHAIDRYEREMHSVSLSAEKEKVALDWTFQMVKNYNLPSANAIHWK
jgi:hypothetical protein